MKKIRPYLRILGSVFGTVLLIYQFYKGYLAISEVDLTNKSFVYLGLGFLLTIFVIWTFYIAWKILLSGFGLSLPYFSGFRGFMLSFVARYIPGTIWGYMNRNEWLAQQYRVPYKLSTKALIYEITLTILASLVMVGLLLIIQTSDIIVGLFYSLLLVILLISSWILIRRIFNLKIIKNLFNDAYFIPNDNYSFGKWLASLGILVGNWFLYGAMLFCCVQALSLDFQLTFNPKIITQFSAIFSLSWLAGFVIPFLPSGIGVREVTLTMLLSTELGFDQSNAAAISVSARLITTIAELFWILLFLVSPFGKSKNINP